MTQCDRFLHFTQTSNQSDVNEFNFNNITFCWKGLAFVWKHVQSAFVTKPLFSACSCISVTGSFQ